MTEPNKGLFAQIKEVNSTKYKFTEEKFRKVIEDLFYGMTKGNRPKKKQKLLLLCKQNK